jgi:hypothetical protein
MSDTELVALEKFACPACGARAVWTPSKKALVCSYCGTESPAELRTDGNLVVEHDLVTALQKAREEGGAGWQAEKQTVRCQSCRAVTVFDPRRVAQNCDFCGAPALIPVEDAGRPITPGGLLPFKVAEGRVREDIRKWYGSHFWAPNALGQKAMTDTLHGLYLPFWTFDAQADCPWQAEAGYYYWERTSQGKMERRVRWQHASGRVQHFFDDVLLCASKGLHPKLMENVGPFPTTTDLLPYDPGYLSGWVVEQYQVDLIDGAQRARDRMTRELRRMCAGQVPGDTHRGLRIQPEFSGQTFKHVLLPVWVLSYQYHAKTYQVAVNGFTGKITGEYPLSWAKVTVAVVVALAIGALALWWAGGK